MPLRRIVLVALVLALAGVAGSAAAWRLPAANGGAARSVWSWSGTWTTSWGAMVLTQSGEQVSGSYDGVLHGKKVRSPGTISGHANPSRNNELTGGWKEGARSGWIKLTSDGKDFGGSWGCDGCGTQQIIGTRGAVTPETTTKATTTAKPTTTTPKPPPSGAATISGRATDGYGDPVQLAYVRAVSDAGTAEAITDETGAFRFTGLTAGKTYRLEAWLQLMTGLANRPYLRIRYRTPSGPVVKAVTKAFTLPAAGARVAVDFARTDELQPSLSAPVPEARLGESAVMYFHTVEAVYEAASLLSEKILRPVDIVAFAGQGNGAWWHGPFTTPKSSWSEPEQIFHEDSDSDYSSWDKPMNSEWHEFGHHFMASLLGRMPNDPQDRNHGGYCRNPSTTDSWDEGFAEFFSVLVAKDVAKRSPAERYLFGTKPNAADLEVDWTAWTNEEFAVAALLLDLVDGPAWNGGKDDDSIQIAPKALMAAIRKGASAQPDSNGHIFDMVDLYTNLAALKVGAGDSNGNGRADLNDLFIAHGFFADKDGDHMWQKGETIGFSDSRCNTASPRRRIPDLPGSFVRFTAVEPGGKAVAGVSFRVSIAYGAPYARFGHTDTLAAPSTKRLYFTLAPTGGTATITASAPGHRPSAPFVVDSTTYWSRLSGKAAVPLATHAFVLAPLAPGATTTPTTTSPPSALHAEVAFTGNGRPLGQAIQAPLAANGLSVNIDPATGAVLNGFWLKDGAWLAKISVPADATGLGFTTTPAVSPGTPLKRPKAATNFRVAWQGGALTGATWSSLGKPLATIPVGRGQKAIAFTNAA